MQEKIYEDMKRWGEDDTIQKLKDNIEVYEITISALKEIDNEEVQEIIKDCEEHLC